LIERDGWYLAATNEELLGGQDDPMA
jgi:hypothetical protein